MLNQPNSAGDTEAGYCSVCKNGLLNKAAFKGHVFTAAVATTSSQRAPFVDGVCKFIINLHLNTDLCSELEQPSLSTQRGNVKCSTAPPRSCLREPGLGEGEEPRGITLALQVIGMSTARFGAYS